MAGPEGCSVKNMVAKAAEYQLGFAWEDNANQRAGITQSVHNTQAGLRLVGLTGGHAHGSFFPGTFLLS